MSVNIRKATEEDLDWIMGQLREFDKFAAYGKSLIGDEQYAISGIKTLIKDHVVFIAENSERMGFIAAYNTGHMFNPKIKVLTECFWWVAEKHRNTRAGLMLLDELTEYGAIHADWIIMSLEAVSPVNPKTLTRRGFALKESSFLLEVA